MKRLMMLAVVVAGASAALAGPTTMMRPQTSLSPQTRQALAAGLSAQSLRTLGLKITPAEQLRVLKSDSGYAAKLGGVTLPPVTLHGTDAWLTGIALTPLAPDYPAGSAFNAAASLNSRAITLGPGTPLAKAGQTPPLLWLWVAGNEDPLLWVHVKWPQPGLYMLTFSMHDLFPTSIARPRARLSDGQTPALIPDTQVGGTKWTMLCDGTDPQKAETDIALRPEQSGLGFTFCCLSQVVITRLQ